MQLKTLDGLASKKLKKEAEKDQVPFMMNLNIQPSDAELVVNGLYFDLDFTDLFPLLDMLPAEGRVLDGLDRLMLTDTHGDKMVVMDFLAP